MTNEPIDALLKTGGSPGGEAEEDDDDQNLMEEEVSAHNLYRNDEKDVESDPPRWTSRCTSRAR